MYACRLFGDASQKELVEAFQLKHLGSSSYSINKVKREIEQGQWKRVRGPPEYVSRLMDT